MAEVYKDTASINGAHNENNDLSLQTPVHMMAIFH